MDMFALIIIMAVFSYLLSNPTFIRIVSWITIAVMTGLFAWVSWSSPEIRFYHVFIGTIIFLLCAEGSFLFTTKVMDSLWPDMMLHGIGEGKPIFVARFWAGFWGLIIPTLVAALIGGATGIAYYSKVVDGYTGIFPTANNQAKQSKERNGSDSQHSSASIDVTMRYINAKNLNLRSGPGVNNSVISTLTKGQQITLLSEETSSDGKTWAHIKAGDTDGWVYVNFLTSK